MIRLFTLLFILTASLAYAQMPQAIKYQAVARDASGQILSNQNVSVRVSIIDSSAAGTIAYAESFKTG
ncbi:MAG: hypothetical protein SFW35_04295, partial [Chitinophagales bacterium]|nr:hypothetical protein [Chitinophagales bacterium]